MAEQAYYQTPGHIIAMATVLPVLDILAVALRFYTRRKQRLPLKADDWLLIPAVLLTVAAGAALVAGVALHAVAYQTPPMDGWFDAGNGRSAFTITSQVQWAFYVISIPAIGCVKLSFLFFYHRIFCTGKRNATSWINFALMAIMMIWTLGCWFELVFACGTKFNHFWSSIPDLASCGNIDMYLFAGALSDCITDVLIILFPIPLVWRLHMDCARKLAVSAVFLLGSVAVAASTTRLVFISKVASVGFDPAVDIDLEITLALYWAMLELGLALFAACLPTLHFLFRGVTRESLLSSIRSIASPRNLRSREQNAQGPQFQSMPSAEEIWVIQRPSPTASLGHLVHYHDYYKDAVWSETHGLRHVY